MTTQTIDSKAGEPHTKPRLLKPERVNVAVDHEDSSSIDFCVQESGIRVLYVTLYVRPTEEDIFGLQPRLKEYRTREFAGQTLQHLHNRVIAHFFAADSFDEIHEDIFHTREALDQRKAAQYIFAHKHKKALYEKFQLL